MARLDGNPKDEGDCSALFLLSNFLPGVMGACAVYPNVGCRNRAALSPQADTLVLVGPQHLLGVSMQKHQGE